MLNHFYSWDTINTKEHLSQIALRMHNERKKLGLTLDKLANTIGYSKPTVQSWEKGWENGSGQNTLPSLESLIKLCDLYETSMEYLLCVDKMAPAISDISSQTGLTKKSIKKLHKLFSDELLYYSRRTTDEIPKEYNPKSIQLDEEWRINLLAFINYFIQNADKLQDILSRRRPIALLQNGLTKEKRADILKEIYIEVCKNRTIALDEPDFPFLELIFDNMVISNISTRKFDFAEQTELFSLFKQYYFVLNNDLLKRSDFEISDVFMDITKEFFLNIYSYMSEYHDFVDEQKSSSHHLIPESSSLDYYYNLDIKKATE